VLQFGSESLYRGIALAGTAAAIGRIVWFMRSRRVRDCFAPERDGRICRGTLCGRTCHMCGLCAIML
jgi:hypothetical protein